MATKKRSHKKKTTATTTTTTKAVKTKAAKPVPVSLFHVNEAGELESYRGKVLDEVVKLTKPFKFGKQRILSIRGVTGRYGLFTTLLAALAWRRQQVVNEVCRHARAVEQLLIIDDSLCKLIEEENESIQSAAEDVAADPLRKDGHEPENENPGHDQPEPGNHSDEPAAQQPVPMREREEDETLLPASDHDRGNDAAAEADEQSTADDHAVLSSGSGTAGASEDAASGSEERPEDRSGLRNGVEQDGEGNAYAGFAAGNGRDERDDDPFDD